MPSAGSRGMSMACGPCGSGLRASLSTGTRMAASASSTTPPTIRYFSLACSIDAPEKETLTGSALSSGAPCPRMNQERTPLIHGAAAPVWRRCSEPENSTTGHFFGSSNQSAAALDYSVAPLPAAGSTPLRSACSTV
jgi:hypothetical protein